MDSLPAKKFTDEPSNNPFEVALLELINRKLGIVVKASQLTDLHKIVEGSCQQLKISPSDYLATLQKADGNSPILKNLINTITIGETYFFRDEKQMQLLQQVILPKLIAKKRAQQHLSLRIWSAGCASGEELYSIIIMLNEMVTDIAAWNLHLLGTDINAQVLQKALSGQYSEWSMRAISNYYKEKYLKKENQYYCLDKKIIASAQFNYLNLNDDTYPSIINGTSGMDLILCRNVLIYFDAAHSQEIMRKFSASLVEEGYLLLGASDPIETANTGLALQAEYGKLLMRTTIKPSLKTVSNKDYVNEQSNAKPDVTVTASALPITIVPEKTESADILCAKAVALANLGQLEEAAACCVASLKMDTLNLTTYFTYAMVLVGLHEPEKAEAALRKTLFLDRDFVLGHYQLGLLLIRKNQIELGLKSLQNAYAITEKQDFELSVPGYENLTFGKLTDILREEIKLHEIGSNAHEAG